MASDTAHEWASLARVAGHELVINMDIDDRYHPDKNNGSKEAEAVFIKIQEAYEVLKDEQKRRAYDAAFRYSRSQRSSSSSNGSQGRGRGGEGSSSSDRANSQGGDGHDEFSFNFDGRNFSFEALADLIKEWERQAPPNIREAMRSFNFFLNVSEMTRLAPLTSPPLSQSFT